MNNVKHTQGDSFNDINTYFLKFYLWKLRIINYNLNYIRF